MAIEPLRLSFEVSCPAEHAFRTWTERISTWWPKSHTVSGDAGLAVVLEGRPGGRIFERTPSGQEIDWGEVVEWEPPLRLTYWWHIRRDREDATEVAINFVNVAGDRTRIDIEHRGWDRLGERGQSWRDANQAGWDGLLPHFIAACL